MPELDLGQVVGEAVNRNLLDNAYFVGGGSQQGGGQFPVNQRGQTIYSAANAYCIDRWKLVSGSLSVVSGGITLNGTIVQYLEQAVGGAVTASALLSDGTMLSPSYDDATKTFTLTASGQTIKAVKLELGAVQTLARQENGVWVLNEIPGFQQELAKCQRFQAPIFQDSYTVGVIRADAAGVLVLFTLPVPLRGAATITNMFTANVYGDVSTVVAYLNAGTSLDVKGNQVAVDANLTATDPANANKFVQIVPAQNNILDANLYY